MVAESNTRPISGKEVAPLLTLPSKRSEARSGLGLLAKGIDEWPTYTELKAVYRTSSLPYYIVQSMAIDQQLTVPMPVFPVSDKEVDSVSSEGYVALLRKLAKDSGIYALASFVTPLIALVLAPFLTRSLSHADYGALTVLNTTIALVAGITQFGLGSAFFRAYSCDYESVQDRRGVLSTVMMLLALGALPTSVAAVFLAPQLSSLLFGSFSYVDAIKIAALVVLLQNMTVPGFSWLRAENKAGFFALLSIANLLVGLGATLMLIGSLHMGIVGAVLATGCGYALVVLCTLPLMLVRAGMRIRRDIAKNVLSFGLPLVSNFISVWVLQLSDRYLLSRFSSLSETASYGVAYTLGGVMSVVVLSPFILAWPSAMFAIAKRRDAVQVFQMVFRWFSLVLLVAAYGLSLISMAVLNLFFPPSYHAAAAIIPIVALSLVFYGIYNIVTVGVSIQRKTWLAAIFTTLSALINIAVNIILIPRYGSMGAAASTLIAYALLAVVAYSVNQRIYYVPFEVGLFLLALSLGLILYIGTSIFVQNRPVHTVEGIYLGTFGFYVGCLMLLGILARHHSKQRDRQVEEVLIS
ncbi:MAG: polysaccharide biosynthesis C-terminal domain-containing protein [Chloroflexota bacterium]|nr:polysaccharide biosynthesis C-terminal domain-containing protein [Chloroflexota bacterium]